MHRLAAFILASLSAGVVHAGIVQSSWTPIFVGVDHATGLMTPGGGDPRLQRVNAVRVDLQAPGVSFYSTPAGGTNETITQTTRAFLEQHDAQVAINANFWGAGNPYVQENVDLIGLAISNGQVVSPTDNVFSASLVISTENHAGLVTAGTGYNSTGVWTAVSGLGFVLQNGSVTGQVNDVQPRTGICLSADERYLFLLTIDGRQPGVSDGATFRELGDWLLRFGASNGITMDGGGSTTLARDDGSGNALLLNVPSGSSGGVVPIGTERWNGNHLAVFATALPEPGGMLLVVLAVTTLSTRRRRSAS